MKTYLTKINTLSILCKKMSSQIDFNVKKGTNSPTFCGHLKFLFSPHKTQHQFKECFRFGDSKINKITEGDTVSF